MPAHPGLAAWLAMSRAIVAEVKLSPATGPVVVVLRDGSGWELVSTLPGEEVAAGPIPALSPLERRIVEAVRSAGVLTAKQLAARLRVACDGGFRAILANLCEREPPVLASGHDGYRVAGM